MQEQNRSAFQRLDTAAFRGGDRFDYWRSIHPGTRLELAGRDASRDFEASNLTCTTSEGAIFSLTTSTGTRAYFGEGNPDLVLLAYLLRGTINIHSNHEETTFGAGEGNLMMIDCRHRATISTCARHTHMYLALPRRLAIDAMGGDPTSGKATRTLPGGGLFPFLLAQLRTLAVRGTSLRGTEAEFAVDMATLLALSGLRQFQDGSSPQEISAQAALFAQARRLIELRHGEHGLTAEGIAASLGCSRAHLYRAFAAHSTSIAALMRDIRLSKARAMLAQRTYRSIASIAHDCGYGDVASFGRAFRTRFGISPAAWRDREN